jgi:hypothetical protein
MVLSASFSPDGTRVVTVSWDKTARVWDAKTGPHIASNIVEDFTAFVVGARLNPELGGLELVSSEQRIALWKTLEPALAKLPDWRFAAAQTFPRDPTDCNRFSKCDSHIAPGRDFTHSHIHRNRHPRSRRYRHKSPLLPFALAYVETTNTDQSLPLGNSTYTETPKTDTQAANPIRAAWLIDYGLKGLPSDTSAADLRIAADLVSKVAESVPKVAIHKETLLDRAKAIEAADVEKVPELRRLESESKPAPATK